MRRRDILLGGIAVALGLAVGQTGVEAGQAASRDDRIRTLARRIEQAATALGESAGHERLAAQFRVTLRVVSDLHDQKLDSGEVAVVLALAELGAISSDVVLGWWASNRLSWSQIADRLTVDTRRLLQRLEEVRQALARPAR
jgi:hypothetical protein